MTMTQKIASRLAQTTFGRRALTEEPDLRILKSRPTVRVYFGLALMVASYLISLLGMALSGYMAHELSEPLIMILGAVVVLIIVHLIFAVGVYMAGANYAKILAVWALGKFLKKSVPKKVFHSIWKK